MIDLKYRWSQEESEIPSSQWILADTISDLRTEENSISTWYLRDLSLEEKKKGVQALTSGFRSLDSIHVVFMDCSIIEKNGLMLNVNEGVTKIEQFKMLHRDIEVMNVVGLQKLAMEIFKCIWSDKTEVFYKEQISRWLLDALNDSLLEFKSLEKGMQQSLAASINNLIKNKKIDKNNIAADVWSAIDIQLRQNKKKTNCQYELECPKY